VALDEGGEVVGYGGLQVILDEGYIANIAVSPKERQKGIATQLLEVFINFAKGNKLAFLTLEVRAGNLPAIVLYGKHGFRTVGRRKNYYEHPKEDALIMTWKCEDEN
jgi:ribosomal-protein-alanine N-acetyltransferase